MASWENKIFFINRYKEVQWTNKDSHAYNVDIWREGYPNDEYSAYCENCVKTFSITNMRFAEIESNAKNRAKHKACLKSYLSRNVFVNSLATLMVMECARVKFCDY